MCVFCCHSQNYLPQTFPLVLYCGRTAIQNYNIKTMHVVLMYIGSTGLQNRNLVWQLVGVPTLQLTFLYQLKHILYTSSNVDVPHCTLILMISSDCVSCDSTPDP